MEMTNATWKASTSKIFNGVMLFSLSGIIGAIIGAIALVFGSMGGVFIITLLIGLATLGGYILYLMGLGNFKNQLTGGDAAAISKVYMAALLSILAVIVAFIPVIGSIAGIIIGIIAYILNVMAYSYLKKSATFPALARKGANKLFIAYILYLIGAICTVTVILAAIGGILNLIAFIMILIGWSNIKSANPEEV